MYRLTEYRLRILLVFMVIERERSGIVEAASQLALILRLSFPMFQKVRRVEVVLTLARLVEGDRTIHDPARQLKPPSESPRLHLPRSSIHPSSNASNRKSDLFLTPIRLEDRPTNVTSALTSPLPVDFN